MEREPKSPEQYESNAGSTEIERAAAERLGELEQTPETSESKPEQIESARQAIEQQPELQSNQAERENMPQRPSGLDRLISYRDTMLSLQRRLQPAQRTFSKFIHSPGVDKASEVVGNTVMRPSVTTGATLTALTVGLFFYIVAKRYGFVLSGSEFILSLLIGGLLGLAVEFIIKTTRKLKRK